MIFFAQTNIENASMLSRSELRAAEHGKGRELCFELLERHFGLKEPVILLGEHGKPYVEAEGVHFSISHSHGLVCCAVADEPIGIDVEVICERSADTVSGIAKRFFTSDERDFLEGHAFSSEAFYYVWTRKEAMSKCLGTPLMSVASRSSLDPSLRIESDVKDGYIISIAINI